LRSSMPVFIRCPDCQKLLKVKEELAGKKVKCPSCSKPVRVPVTEPEVVGVEEVVDEPAEAPSRPPSQDIPVSVAEMDLNEESGGDIATVPPIQRQPLSRPGGGPPRRGEVEMAPEHDYPGVKRVRFPVLAGLAGVIWILFGIFFLLGSFVVLALVVIALAAAPSHADPSHPAPELLAVGVICPLALAFFFGAVFLFVGIQTVRGKSAEILSNAIGSILIGLLIGAWGVFALSDYMSAKTKDVTVAEWTRVGIGAAGFIVLFFAGILALGGSGRYKAWRKAEKAARQQGPR
jgi:hypothetical protein